MPGRAFPTSEPQSSVDKTIYIYNNRYWAVCCAKPIIIYVYAECYLFLLIPSMLRMRFLMVSKVDTLVSLA